MDTIERTFGGTDSVERANTIAPSVAGVRRVKAAVAQPVTFCENYVPWIDKLQPLVEELDFISVHAYPVWEYRSIDDAIGYTRQNYYSVADRYPDKPVIITEAGWATSSSGRGIEPWRWSCGRGTATLCRTKPDHRAPAFGGDPFTRCRAHC